MKPDGSSLANKNGSILVIVLVALIAVTALALTMINFTTQEVKMAGHYKFSKMAFYNGDSGIYGTPKFIRLLYPEGDPVAEEDPAKAGCVRFLNLNAGNAAEEIRARVYGGFRGAEPDITGIYNDDVDSEQQPAAADISMRGCQIPADVNIINLGAGDEEENGSGRAFGAGADGLGSSSSSDQTIRFRLVSTGSDEHNNTHTIRAIYRWKNVPGGL